MTAPREGSYEMLVDIDEHGQGLTSWETKFIASLMGSTSTLTRNQWLALRRIHKDRVPEEWR